MWCLGAKCLYIQTSLAVNCLPATSDCYMCNNDGLENLKKKKKKKKNFFFFFLVFSHPGGSVSLPGVRESGCISGRLPDDPGGFTCMQSWSNFDQVRQRGVYTIKVSKSKTVKVTLSNFDQVNFDSVNRLLQIPAEILPPSCWTISYR